MTNIFVSYRHGDDSARRIYDELSAVFGPRAVFGRDDLLVAGSDYHDVRQRTIRSSEVFVVVIGPEWLKASDSYGRRRIDDPNDAVRMEVASALGAGKRIIPVLVGGATMPSAGQLPDALRDLASHQSLAIPLGSESGAGLSELVAALKGVQLPPAPTFSPMPAPSAWEADRTIIVPRAPPSASRPPATLSPAGRPQPSPAPSAAPRRSSGVLAGVVNGLRSLWSRKSPVDPGAAAEHPAASASRANTEVLLAASAPRSASLNAEFSAALVAYIAGARASALKKLADLGEPDDRRVEDVATTAWRIGAPVTVRLAGNGIGATPPEVRFDWSGHENLAAFSVKVDSTPRDAIVLSFEVLVADVLVASIPMRVALGSASDTKAINRAQGALPSSAFASYSSQDAEPVTQRLSTLSRWAPGLDIFQDCLDLTPGEAFKPQLEGQIAHRDVFLLFWSRTAAASPWVRWEYTTALERKGLAAILPMPLEDPAIAPPPLELADQHQRDRFMLAGYGLAKVREQASKGS